MFEDLIPHLRYAIARAGATDVGVVDVLAEPVPQAWDLDALRRGNARAREAYRAMFAGVDGAIMMPGATPAHPAYAALQDLLKQGRGRTVHFHWVENGSAFPLPGQPLPGRAAIDALYQRALLQTDYAALARVLERFEQALRAGEVHITSPGGTNLRFRIGERPVNRQDGDASAARTARGTVLIDREIELPAGVVRVAPLEESVQGTIAFPPSQWDARPVGRAAAALRARPGGAGRGDERARGGRARDAGGRGRRTPLPRVRAGLQPAAGRARAHAVDSLLRLRRRRGPPVARRQLRARRRGRRRLRALELLHRPDGDRERPGVGEGRPADRPTVGASADPSAGRCCHRNGRIHGMKTTIDKAGRVVIPASVRERAGFEPGTTLDISMDEFGVRLQRVAPGPRLVRVGGRLVARPVVEPEQRPVVDVAALVEEERNRWP